MKNIIIIVTLFTILTIAQSVSPKREFRGVWVATVSNLDWPTTKNNVTTQKAELTSLLDSMAAAGMNVAIFQVRPAADALYSSALEPWSYWLTGTQGLAPSPAYDPLQYAITEAHKRGIELHAWFNPYRAVEGSYTLAANHVINQHPDWILTVGAGAKKILNPGLADVRTYVLNVISDVLKRYDVDGVHMDDYFYPYPSNNITSEDTATFRLYPRGFTNINSWRRDNVNLLIKGIMDSVQTLKPKARFGMSPFGIWKNGVPTGISGMDAYSTIYCDAIQWLQNRAVDYLTPQLYWKIGGSQDYLKLLTWWADSVSANQRHFYPGQTFGTGYTNAELPNQIVLNRADPAVGGNVIFRAGLVKSNNLNFKDSLKQTYHIYPAILPVISWKDNVNPLSPVNLTATNVAGAIRLNWIKPASASDGDSAYRFIVYRSTTTTFDLNNPAGIIKITANDTNSYTDNAVVNGQKYYYYVTSLDRSSNESSVSNISFAVAGFDNAALADFESSVGLFDRAPTYSGSTYGIAGTSTSARSTEFAHGGVGSLKLTLKDNTASDTTWRVRLLSGSGSAVNNTALPYNGNINFWLKTSNASTGASVAITVDDAAGGTELSPQITVNNDGAWHQYSFDLQSAGWSSFASGNGRIDGPTVTLDAIMIYSPNRSTDWICYIDDLGYNSSGTPLPVELQLFAVKQISGNKARLEWSTATEINNYGFEIERSYQQDDNSVQWERIGFVAGHGNSAINNSYSFIDNSVLTGRNIKYRLKQLDHDGSFQYSTEVSLRIQITGYELAQNYPNPFNPSTIIRFSIPEGAGLTKTKLAVYDVLGSEVAILFDKEVSSGVYEVPFDAASYRLSSGVYIYRLSTGATTLTRKMMLAK